jgi:glycosyltransferase involved in cell wall biosynthesis
MAAAIVMQTERGREWGLGFLPSNLMAVIENPVDDSFASEPIVPIDRRPLLVMAAGRLTYQKGFDLLIEAFASSKARHFGWILRICGAGEEITNLKKLAELADVSGVVELPGLCQDLRAELSSAQVFVLSSRSEGFPNVLLEAMASGCAVIAADCPSGPAEIVIQGVNGLLIKSGDSGALRDALDSLCARPILRQKLSSAAEQVRTRFSSFEVASKWLALFQRIADSND